MILRKWECGMIEETNPSVVIKNFQQNNNRVMTTKKQLQLFGAQFLSLSADGGSALRSLLALLLQLLAEVFPVVDHQLLDGQ